MFMVLSFPAAGSRETSDFFNLEHDVMCLTIKLEIIQEEKLLILLIGSRGTVYYHWK